MSSTVSAAEGDKSLSTQIYEALRDQIIEGVLLPGAHLRERELAEEFHVSRIPLREAIPRLEADGLVTTSQRRGAVVSELTVRDVEELFVIRLSLEVLAAREAALSVARGESTEHLSSLMAQAEDALARGDDREIATANSAFHEEILTLTRNSLLQDLMVPVTGRVRRLFRLEATRDQAVLCREHQGLHDAIAAGNVELSGSLAYAHVEHSRVESLALVERMLPPSR